MREPDKKEHEEEETSDFTELEEWTFRDLRTFLAQVRHSPGPEVNQVQSEPVRELDGKAPEEDHESWINMMMESQEEETPGNNTFSTSEPQCNELSIGTYEHPCQLPQEQCETSDYLSKNQEKEAGDQDIQFDQEAERNGVNASGYDLQPEHQLLKPRGRK